MPHNQPEVHLPTTVFHEDVGIGRNTIYGDRLFNDRYDVLTLPVGAFLVFPTTIAHRVTRNNWGGQLQDQSYIRICNTREIALGEQQDLKDNFGIDSNILPITVNVEVGELAGINTTQLGDVYNDADYTNGDMLRWDEGFPITMVLNYPITANVGDIIFQERMGSFATVAADVSNVNTLQLKNSRGVFKTENNRESDISLLAGGLGNTQQKLLHTNNQNVRPISVTKQSSHSGEGQKEYASFYPSKLNNYGPNEPEVKYSGDIWFNTNEGDLLMWNGDAWVEVIPRVLKDSGGGANIDMSVFSPVALSGDYNDLLNVPTSSGGGGSGVSGVGDTVTEVGQLSSAVTNALLDPVIVPKNHTLVVFTVQPKLTEQSEDYVAIYDSGNFDNELAKGEYTAIFKNTGATSRNVRIFVTENLESGSQAIYMIYANDILDIATIQAQFATVAVTGQYSDLQGAPTDISALTDTFDFLQRPVSSFVQSTAPTERSAAFTGPSGTVFAQQPLRNGDLWFDEGATGQLYMWDGDNWIQVTGQDLTTINQAIGNIPTDVTDLTDTTGLFNTDVSELTDSTGLLSSGGFTSGGNFTTPDSSGTATIATGAANANKPVFYFGFNFHSSGNAVTDASGNFTVNHSSSSDPERWYYII